MHIIVSTVVGELTHVFLGLPNKGIGTSGKCKCFARWSVLSFTSWQKRGMVPYVGCAKHLAAVEEVRQLAKNCPRLRYVNLESCLGVSDLAFRLLVVSCPDIETLLVEGCPKLLYRRMNDKYRRRNGMPLLQTNLFDDDYPHEDDDDDDYY